MRILGRVLLTLVLVAFLAVGGVWGASVLKINRKVKVKERALTITADSASLARGQKVATAMGKCQDCHGPDFGGKVFIQDAAFGTYVAPNLTAGAGSQVASYSPAMWDAAIRHAVGPDGHKLAFMPAEAYEYLTDQDLAALVAFLQALPRVDRVITEKTAPGPLGRALYVTGKVPLYAADVVRHDSVGMWSQPLGEYLAYTGGCHSCHGPKLLGGKMPGSPPDEPPARNIGATGMPGWTEADFLKAMRTGTRPDGTVIDPFMPWALTGQLSDEELSAIYAYLRSVKPGA